MKQLLINISFSVHGKLTTLGMHSLHVIPENINKWHIQLMHILSDIAFLIPARYEFL
jgi:hypothetical protein